MASLIEGLPDAVTLQCLARLPLSALPALHLVCKSWRSTIRSPDLFHVRKNLGTQEPWLYVCTKASAKTWQAYDPVGNKWTLLPPLPSTIPNHADFGSIGCDGKLYVLGGMSEREKGPAATAEAWAFDPVKREWGAIASMITPRAYFACMVYEGRIVVGGGYDVNRKPVFSAEAFDPEKGEWRPFASLKWWLYPVARGVVHEGKMRVFHVWEAQSQVYDPVTDSWECEECAWAGGRMAVVNQELYVLLRVVRNYSEHGSSFAHRVHPLYTWPEWVDRKLFGVIGMGSELYLVGGTMRTLPGAAAGDNETLNDVDICTIECGTKNLKWRKGASMPLSGANVQGCTVLEL